MAADSRQRLGRAPAGQRPGRGGQPRCRGVTVTLAPRVFPYLKGTHHEQTSQHRYATDLISVLRALEEFVVRHMRGWSRDLEELSPDGLRFKLVYSRQLSQRQQLLPSSVLASMKESLELCNNRRYKGAFRPVQYELSCVFDLMWEGTDQVELQWHAVEDIDVNIADERAVGRHYRVPSQFLLQRWPGDELHPFLTSRLRV